MKKTLLFTLALAVVCIMPSCVKDPKPSDEPTINQIAFGNYESMNVVTYDSIIDNGSIYLDIDNDGVKDFSLDNPYFDSFTDNYPQEIRFTCLQPYKYSFQGRIEEKVVYLHCEYNYVDSLDKVLAFGDCTYSHCGKITDNDEEEHYNELHVYPHEANELLGLDDEFSDSQFILFRNDYSFQDPDWYEDGDTVYIYTTTYINHCDNFPIDTPFYIGFRSSGQKELLGWFKLMLHSVNEGENVRLELIEIAIQE